MLLIVFFCEAWMEKQEIIDSLEKLQHRLHEDVYQAYARETSDYGRERYDAWKKSVTKFLNQYIPNEIQYFNEKANPVFGVLPRRNGMPHHEFFWKTDGSSMNAYLESLILDIKNDEYDFTPINKEVKQLETKAKSKKVFIVHGHDEAVKERTARFLEKIGFEAMILSELPSMGKTIIEKIEHYAQDTNFAIVLYTPDDKGETAANVDASDLQYRARQNVIFEHGYLIGLLKRKNVTAINVGKMELPSDIHGMVYIGDDWKSKIVQEMRAAGYSIDSNKL